MSEREHRSGEQAAGLQGVMANIQKTDTCWLWTGTRHHTGYGRIEIQGKSMGAHRAIWILLNGPLRPDQHVCHRCDNPPCVNPDHLFIGTRSDNMRDCVAKGRKNPAHPKGESHPRSRLTEASVRAMRVESMRGDSTSVLSERYGISASQVQRIIAGKRWGHIPLPTEGTL